MSESLRSFIAFDIDNEAVLTRLKEFQQAITETGADLKLVKPENIHMTIRFLGNIAPYMVDRVFDVIRQVKFKPFRMTLRGVGAFPNPRNPRVVWAHIREGAEQLRVISEQLETSLVRLGFAPDRKGFTPHLTVARVRSGKNRPELTSYIHSNADYEFGIIDAKCLRLKRSVLTPQGPIYSILKEFCPPP